MDQGLFSGLRPLKDHWPCSGREPFAIDAAFADHAGPSTTLRYIERRDEDRKRASQAAAGADLFSHQLDRWLAAA